MLHMLGALEVSAKLPGLCIRFKFIRQLFFRQAGNNFHNAHGIVKQNVHLRHLNISLQKKFAKKLTNIRMDHFPKPIICNNHVHYIGNKDLRAKHNQN